MLVSLGSGYLHSQLHSRSTQEHPHSSFGADHQTVSLLRVCMRTSFRPCVHARTRACLSCMWRLLVRSTPICGSCIVAQRNNTRAFANLMHMHARDSLFTRVVHVADTPASRSPPLLLSSISPRLTSRHSSSLSFSIGK